MKFRSDFPCPMYYSTDMHENEQYIQLGASRITIPDCGLLTVELSEVCLLIKGVHMSHEVNEQSVPSYGDG